MFCEKICKNCGNKFTTHRYRAKTAVYCSKDCYTSHGNMELKCGGCGINYTAEKNLYDNGFSVRFFCKNCREKNTISAFELDVRQTLIENGFTIETNRVIKKPLGGYIYPDIIISNTVIECNGDFFHCNPEIYDENFKNPKTGLTAKQIWERDKFKNDTYVAAGYNTITLWESKWRDDKEYRQNLVDILRKYEV
jgi:G:T-mismatch repair DNA endonuclease (very short patch repair protein)